jgi:hypothetical protein
MQEENNCDYVCSRGILKSCGIHSNQPISSIQQMLGYDFTNFRPGMTVYVASTALREFVNWIQMFPGAFILVTGDCDLCVPNDVFPMFKEFLDFIEHPKIIHWYSQNCVGKHPKLSQIPIGLDYHTMSAGHHSWGPQTTPIEQEIMLKQICMNAEPFWNRKVKCYGNFQFLMTTRFSYDRGDAINKVPQELVFYEPTHTLRENCWKNQADYAFVLSPHGNGLDCHRTWEALCLGCIVIVKTSALDPLYERLPVLIVKEWSDVNKALLDRIVGEYKTKTLNGTFRFEKLKLGYWMDIITNARRQ